MRFCPACGGPIEARRPPGDERERAVCAACGTVHYVNPKLVVGSVCSFGDQVLICRRAIPPRAGFWTLPAGYMELGETAEEGAAREAWEEARARIRVEGLLAVYSVRRIDQVQLIYKARLLDAAVEAGPESLEVSLVRWADIPWDGLAFPTVGWALRRARELRAAPEGAPLVTAGNPDGAEPPEAGEPPRTAAGI